MSWAVYGRTDGEFRGVEAFVLGLKALGVPACPLSLSDHCRGQLLDVDAVAVFGLQGLGQSILREYEAKGIPVFVVDFGYFNRATGLNGKGMWQVSLGDLNRPPMFDCGTDRWEALGLDIVELGGTQGGYPLLCVQVPGDRSHGLGEFELHQWCHEQFAQRPDIVIRPHPGAKHLTYGLPVCKADSLNEALAGASVVITGNSNVGHDALLAGVPVITTFSGAAYEHLAGEYLPSVDERLAHFRRCAYGQWSFDEFRTGVAQRFIIDHQLGALHA